MDRRRDLILALDLGTTGNRALVFDRALRVVSNEYAEFTQHYPKPGWVEHDAEEIWRAVRGILRRTLGKVDVSRVASIGITNQRETVVVWDRRTGRPIHRAIVWQCRRTAGLCRDLKKRGYERVIRRKTGLFLDAYFSASKLTWLLENVPQARKRALRGDLLAGTIDTWIIWKLTGGLSHVTDPSNASRTMLFDIRKRSWDASLCRLFRVPMGMLPKVIPSAGVSDPPRTDKTIFGREIPIGGIIGDQQSAAFAQGCYAPGIVKNTYGTGLFMLENTGKKPVFSGNLLSTVAWSIGDLSETEYALEGSVFIGGAAIQWLRDGLKIISKASDTQRLAATLKDNEGVYFVPALVGLGAPYWDPSARGAILGITRGTSRAHIARAALESIAYQTRDIVETMHRDTRRPLRTLRVDGGATANDLLMQIQADLIGIPVERPVVLETTALGAAAMAGLSAGVWKHRRDFQRHRRIDRVFRPKLSSSDRQHLYDRWKRAVSRALSWAD